jgi:hypothetical protein
VPSARTAELESENARLRQLIKQAGVDAAAYDEDKRIAVSIPALQVARPSSQSLAPG